MHHSNNNLANISISDVQMIRIIQRSRISFIFFVNRFESNPITRYMQFFKNIFRLKYYNGINRNIIIMMPCVNHNHFFIHPMFFSCCCMSVFVADILFRYSDFNLFLWKCLQFTEWATVHIWAFWFCRLLQ